MNWIPNERLVISSNKSMTILRKDERDHGVLTLKFDKKRGRVENAAAIDGAGRLFHISLTDPAFDELKQAGMKFDSRWEKLEKRHLGPHGGGTRYVAGRSGFASKKEAVDWFMRQLPSGWSII